ncbi:MAG TPA: serine/threonine-protein kinase PknK [Spirochaetota bacterium]|nr:serine/threonine-protein kinase PknK [Spirochaetota bacterium]HPV40377.1 serine/threonine-protein kinase PknK [Spirochaetota bacterium]
MITLPDYTLIEPVHRGHRTCVYRGIRTSDSLPVIIKTLTSANPSRSEIERLEYEYNLTRSLAASEIVRAYDFINAGYSRALILEDFGGISLHQYLKLARPEVSILLGIAVAIVKAVDVIHRERIIHKDIKPQNIFINKISKEIKITDFSIASRMIKETPAVMNPEFIEGTLAYMSPEQTGRMNRSIDFRSDYYSLGVTLYELFTGVLPFAFSDPMELIHAHIAMQAIPVDRVNSAVPPVLSRIIMKLLSKNAEDRYKTAGGILADLEECLKRLAKYTVVDDFPLGAKDRSDSFIIPEKLYGRNRHLEALYHEYQRVVQGEFRMILCSGPPGIGKSSLIKEIHKPLVKEKGYFISGKFDQYKRTFPYLAFIQAIQDLVRQILTESEEQLENWKKIIVAALENDGPILVNVFPDIELIVGHHTMQDKISAVEMKDRFLAVFLKFIKVFAQRNKPLVLFLDDVQWIDDSSLQLLHALMMNPHVPGLLIIGTYRDGEIEYNEQALRLFEYLEKRKDFWTRVELGTLELEEINSLVSDTLSVPPADSMILSELIVAKTGGNPFFVKEFLINLYQNKYIQLNESGAWQYDIRGISIANMTDNVVDLLIDKYNDLPVDVKELLQTLSCLGSMFSLNELFLFFDTIKVQIFDSIQLAVDNDILIKSNDQLCFSHDRIREAVYATLGQEHREQIHYSIARYLFNKSVVKKNDDDIFNIAHHYNCAVNLLKTADEKETLCRINLKAGIRAKQSIAYEAANDFMKKALESLAVDSWRSAYDLALSIHSEMVELGYLRGNSEEAELHFNIVKNRVVDPIDAVRVYEVIIYHKTALNNMEEAFRLGLEALAMLGMKMPRKPGRAILLKEIVTARINLINKKIEDLADYKELDDPRQASIARLLMCCSEASYITSPEYLPLIILKLLNISLKHGNSIYAPYAYASYGVIVSAFLNNIDLGYKFGKLSLLVLEKYNAEEFKCKVYFLFGNLINHWKNHLRTDLEYLEESYVSGFHMHDPSFASYAVNHYLFHRFFMGEKLDVMKDLFRQYTSIMERFQQLNPTQSFKLWHQLVVNLCGNAADRSLIKGEICDEDVLIPEKIRTKELTCLGFYTVGKMFLHYLYGDYEKAIEVAR